MHASLSFARTLYLVYLFFVHLIYTSSPSPPSSPNPSSNPPQCPRRQGRLTTPPQVKLDQKPDVRRRRRSSERET